MTTSHITDLDVLLATPRQVRLGGQVYKLPGDIPAELYLKIVRYAQADESDVDESDIRGVYEDVLGLFNVHQDMDRLPAALSLPMMVELIGHVYMGAGDEEGPTKAKPKAASKGGTPSSTRRKQTRSRPKR